MTPEDRATRIARDLIVKLWDGPYMPTEEQELCAVAEAIRQHTRETLEQLVKDIEALPGGMDGEPRGFAVWDLLDAARRTVT